MPTPNQIPQSVTESEFRCAMRVLGIDVDGAGLVSMYFDLADPVPKVTVVRNAKDSDGKLVAPRVTVEFGIARGA